MRKHEGISDQRPNSGTGVLQMDAESAFETFGLVWTDPPPLFEMRSPYALNAVQSLDALMDIAEAGEEDAEAVIDVLAAFAYPVERPLSLHLLGALKPRAWAHVALCLDMLRLTQGVSPRDFRDGGQRIKAILDRAERNEA